ncbi:MAG: hypothetical protein H0X14_09160 [Acidobacteria bacterium]|nr:hypothetical protein [Acidobacteriota bacterium]
MGLFDQPIEQLEQEDATDQKKWPVVFACAVVGFVYSLWFVERTGEAVDTGFWLARVLGSTFGLLLIPGIVALIASAKTRKWHYAFAIVFGVLLLLGLLGKIATGVSKQRQASPQHAISSASPLPAQDSNFAKLKLPLGVSVEVPKNWRLLDGDINATIETAAEAALNLSGVDLPKGKKVNLFRANSMPTTTYAAIAINATDSELNPDELKNASEAEIRELSSMMSEMMQKSLAAQNLKVIEFYGVRREYVGKHPALVTEYKRSGPQGPVIVQMTRLFLGQKEISLNLSYRESEAQLWKPIIQYIRKSLTVT